MSKILSRNTKNILGNQGKLLGGNFRISPVGKFLTIEKLDFFNTEEVLTIGDTLFHRSYYGEDGYTNNMNPLFNIRKGVYRLLISKKMKLENSFVAYDPISKGLWCCYNDSNSEELNEAIDKRNGKSMCNRYIMMYGEDEVIKEAYISDNGIKKPYIIGTGKGGNEHSASAYLFYQLCHLLFHNEDKKVKESFEKLCKYFDSPNITDKKMKGMLLTKLENDVYVKVCYMEGQNPSVPFGNCNMPENVNVVVGEINTIASKPKKPTVVKLKKDATVGGIAKKGEFKIDHEFADGEKKLVPTNYDGYIPDENTLTIAKVLQKFKNLPEVPVMNILLTGEAGTGKSTAAQLLARMCNLPYRFITMSADTTVADLLLNILPGKKANTFEQYESEFVKAFRNGGIIEIQEVNTVRKPNVLTSLNAALDGLKELHLPNGEIIKRHENCIVIFTANIGYEGTAPMNQALMSRCCLKLEYQLPSEQELAKRLSEKSGIETDIAVKMVKVMEQIKNILEEEGETLGICSFREITAWAQMSMLLNDVVTAGEITIVNSGSFDPEVKPRLLQSIHNYFM